MSFFMGLPAKETLNPSGLKKTGLTRDLRLVFSNENTSFVPYGTHQKSKLAKKGIGHRKGKTAALLKELLFHLMFSYENISFVCVANSPTVHCYRFVFDFLRKSVSRIVE